MKLEVNSESPHMLMGGFIANVYCLCLYKPYRHLLHTENIHRVAAPRLNCQIRIRIRVFLWDHLSTENFPKIVLLLYKPSNHFLVQIAILGVFSVNYIE